MFIIFVKNGSNQPDLVEKIELLSAKIIFVFLLIKVLLSKINNF